jgi:hypothetical protein
MTMATATAVNRRRELAHRVGSGLEVTLYWNQDDDTTTVEIRHLASDTQMRFAVPPEQALSAFYHPLTHIRHATAA